MVLFRFRHLLPGLLSTMLAGMPSAWAAGVGVSVTVDQPGFYGRIVLGDLPAPELIYPRPIVVRPVFPAIERQPVYLRVPPGHAGKWTKHCHRYAACGQPVYFVQEGWYHRVYEPARMARRGAQGGHEHRADHRAHRKGQGDTGQRGKGRQHK